MYAEQLRTYDQSQRHRNAQPAMLSAQHVADTPDRRFRYGELATSQQPPIPTYEESQMARLNQLTDQYYLELRRCEEHFDNVPQAAEYDIPDAQTESASVPPTGRTEPDTIPTDRVNSVVQTSSTTLAPQQSMIALGSYGDFRSLPKRILRETCSHVQSIVAGCLYPVTGDFLGMESWSQRRRYRACVRELEKCWSPKDVNFRLHAKQPWLIVIKHGADRKVWKPAVQKLDGGKGKFYATRISYNRVKIELYETGVSEKMLGYLGSPAWLECYYRGPYHLDVCDEGARIKNLSLPECPCSYVRALRWEALERYEQLSNRERIIHNQRYLQVVGVS